MSNTVKRTLIISVAIAVYIAVMFLVFPIIMPKKGDIIRIDCTWSEISPDFTTEMRQACRNARLVKTV